MDYDLKRIVKKIELYRRLEREFKNQKLISSQDFSSNVSSECIRS